jgi:hypothetical protein
MQGEVREINQLHFMTWADKSEPGWTFPVLAFLKRVRSFDDKAKGPMVVHCRSGLLFLIFAGLVFKRQMCELSVHCFLTLVPVLVAQEPLLLSIVCWSKQRQRSRWMSFAAFVSCVCNE